MNGERENLLMRAEIIRAYLMAVDEPDRLLRVCAGAPGGEDDLWAAVAAAFAVHEIAARAIIDMQVRRFTPTEREKMRAELDVLQRRLAELDRHGRSPDPSP